MASSFTHDNYRRLLRLTRDAYSIRGFEVLDGSWADDEEFAILRHDIDLSPSRALEIARIEAEEGVRSTYTILLTSDFYNPLEPRARDTLRQIRDLGHELGLHFDAQWQAIEGEADIDDAVRWQADVLSHALGQDVPMFSFHNTTPFSMSCYSDRYGGLRNAYAGRLQQQVSYTSDSNGTWRYRSWDQILDEHPPRIQVLTHPDWWTPSELAPAEKICTELDQRSREVWHHYCELMATSGKRNECDIIDELSVMRELDGDAARLWLSGFRREALIRLIHCTPDSASLVEPEARARLKLLIDRIAEPGRELHPVEARAALGDLLTIYGRSTGNA